MGEVLKPIALLLAGGEARRLGGADKALVALAGQPLIAHSIARLAWQSSEPLINANGDPARLASFGLPVVADDFPGRPGPLVGPLAGLLAGLDWVARDRPDATHVLTLPADTPFPPPDLVARLDRARRDTGAAIAVAMSGGRMHHAVALWPVTIRAALRSALVDDGERAVSRFAARFSVATVEWPVVPYDPFFNINTPDDLARAETIVRSLSAS